VCVASPDQIGGDVNAQDPRPHHDLNYACSIQTMVMSPDEYGSFVDSPFVSERISELEIPLVVVAGRASRRLTHPGSLPVVVCGLGRSFGRDESQARSWCDLIVSTEDLENVAAVIRSAPIASTALTILLRSVGDVGVDAGLAAESSVYSMLQSGPEFASWRGDSDSEIKRDDQAVVVERVGDSLIISLDRPGRHNAVTAQLRDELCAALVLASADDTVERIRFRGNGPSFCSGGDLAEFGSRSDGASAHVVRLTNSPARLLHRLRDRLTAEIHGSTLGGGIEMAAFADRVVAHPDTVIGLPETTLGLIPGAGGTVSITGRIGRQRCAALALTGRTIDAATALRWGLVDEVAVPAELTEDRP